jgi:hexosaminidase
VPGILAGNGSTTVGCPADVSFKPGTHQPSCQPAEALGLARAAHVAGVEAAIWCETISDFDDLAFLLLPRLAGVAHRAWSDPKVASWIDHRDRLARHGRLWSQDGLTFFRPSSVDWL